MPVLNTTPTIKIAQSIAAPYQRAVLTFKRGNNKIIKADPRNVDGIFYVDFSQEDLAYLGTGTASFEIQYFYDSDTKTNIETGGQMPIYDVFSDGKATGTGGIDDETIYTAVVLQETVEVGGGSGGTSDHRLLSNRSADNQHPISAITGLQDTVDKANASIAETTADERYEPKIVDKGDAFNLSFGETPDSVVQGSRVLKAVPADAEFTDTVYDDTAIKASVESLETNKADKTAIPTELPNPNALTFTGASVGSYDGSAPLNINIPSGGGGGSGEDGATFTPAGTVEGSTVTFTWTNDKGRPNPEPVAVTAPQGTKGDKGDPGENGQQGAKGDKGDTGEQGLKGDKGDQGLPGDKGADGAKGDKGDPGENGTNGTNGADAVINGVNTLTIEQGANIQLSQTGSVLTISATSGGSGSTVPLVINFTDGTSQTYKVVVSNE